MKLDRTTYEAWLLDRLEGNLTGAQEQQLDAFLAANPDLDAGTNELPEITPDAPLLPRKEDLKKSYPPEGMPDLARVNDFLVAKLEGALGPEQELGLDRLLFEHPHLRQMAKHIAASKVPATPVPFEGKHAIQRHFPPLGSPDRHRLIDFLIASLEGDLTGEQQRSLDDHLNAHPEARIQQRLVAATRVSSEQIVFPWKEHLRKREGRVIAMWQRYAAAASIALLLGLAWWMSRDRAELPHIAGTKQTAKPSPEQAAAPSDKPTARIDQDVPRADEAATPDPSVVRSAPDHRSWMRGGAQSHTPAVPKAVPEHPAPHQDDTAPASEPQLAEHPSGNDQGPDPDNAMSAADAIHTSDAAGADHVLPARTGEAVTLSAFAANAVRRGVIKEEERAAALDGADAVAAVDKGLGAITGGEGGLDVQRGSSRNRFKLRLGRNLSFSASTAR